MIKKIKIIFLLLTMSQVSMAGRDLVKKDIMGVWQLTKFVLVADDGQETNWCEGAYGTIAYAPELMTVSINCEGFKEGSGAERLDGKLFYSGPFSFNKEKQQVTHLVENYSHKSLHKNYKRLVEMDTEDDLRLVGLLGEGKKVVVEWERVERYSEAVLEVSGSWVLIGSENDVQGSDKKVPFCTGFHGTILYTPGGYAAVSINCGEKEDDSIEEPADQFGRQYFYAGKYYLEDGNLIQTPDNASEVGHIGFPAVRAMNIADDTLTLKGVNGSSFVATWKRIGRFGI